MAINSVGSTLSPVQTQTTGLTLDQAQQKDAQKAGGAGGGNGGLGGGDQWAGKDVFDQAKSGPNNVGGDDLFE